MSAKEIIEKNIKRAAEDVAASKPAPVITSGDDAPLLMALEKVARGELKAARRTRNGTLMETR